MFVTSKTKSILWGKNRLLKINIANVRFVFLDSNERLGLTGQNGAYK